jgi:SsrA-binding protein
VSTPKPNRPAARKPAAAARKPAAADGKPAERVVAENRKARHEYEIVDTLECGIALVGSEVKSLRVGRMSLDEAYGRVDGREVWLIGCDIPEYEKANQLNHQPKRPRKLLLHRREIARFAGQAFEKGLTLVPLKMYFKGEAAIGDRPGSQAARQTAEAQGRQRPARHRSGAAGP